MRRNWVGGHMRPPYSQGQLVRAGAFNAHQHIRTQSSLSDNPDIPEAQDKHVNKVKARQYNRSRAHKQQRGDTFPKLNNVVTGAVELVCQPKYLHTGRTLARSSELPGVPGIRGLRKTLCSMLLVVSDGSEGV